MKTLDFTAINLDLERAQQYPNAAPSEDSVDDLERPVAETAPSDTAKSIFFPVTINPADVREFYPRKGDRVGTRIVYMNGAARPVKETYAEVAAKFAGLNN